MLNSAIPNWHRMRTPATSVGFTSTSTTCDSAIHKGVHKTCSKITFMVHNQAV